MKTTYVGIIALGISGMTACSESTLGPVGEGGTAFSQTITLEALLGSTDAGPTRVEIKLMDGTLIAREVEVKETEELNDLEEIESAVTAVDGVAGTVTLALADFVVTFDGSTLFRSETGVDLGMAEFVSRIEDALAAGTPPAIEAKRPPPLEPQAPDDAMFFATSLEIDDEADDSKIKINIDGDNLVLVDAPPPDALLRVLGLEIEIRSSDGVTDLEEENDGTDEEIEFESLVTSVDEGAGTVLLADGTILVILADTEIREEGDDEHLASLAEVVAALDQGLLVEAEGEGLVESFDPLTILTKEVEFDTEDDVDDLPGESDFEGRVAAIDEGAGTLTLEDGTVIRVDAGTDIKDEDDENLSSLADAAAALAAGEIVKIEGEGVVESMEPLTILASELEMEIDD
ncbi:MAG: DUF5666 domain-containing protein [Gemmatimonadota bacterium]